MQQSTSTMEMSNMSMPDISEEDVIQMDTPGLDTPGYYLGTFVIVLWNYWSESNLVFP